MVTKEQEFELQQVIGTVPDKTIEDLWDKVDRRNNNKVWEQITKLVVYGGLSTGLVLLACVFYGKVSSFGGVRSYDLVEAGDGHAEYQNVRIDVDASSGVSFESAGEGECVKPEQYEDQDISIDFFEGVYEGEWLYENYGMSIDEESGLVIFERVGGEEMPENLSSLVEGRYGVFMERITDLGILSLDFEGVSSEKGFMWIDEDTGEVLLDTRAPYSYKDALTFSPSPYLEIVDGRYVAFSRFLYRNGDVESEMVFVDLETKTQTVIESHSGETTYRIKEWETVNNSPVFVFSYNNTMNLFSPNVGEVRSFENNHDISDFDLSESGDMVLLGNDVDDRSWLQVMNLDENFEVIDKLEIELGDGNFVDVFACGEGLEE